jgi:hypothetical protein
MAVELSKEVVEAFNNPETIKALATVDKNGAPYVVYKGSLHINEDGNIELNEILESSRNNQNLVYSIWFGKQVSVNLLTPEKKSFQLHLKPLKCITSGAYFEAAYKKVRAGGADIDLGAIWQFAVEEEKEETFFVRVKEDEEAYPILKHLDRLLV